MGGRKGPPNLDDYRPTAYFNGMHHTCLITRGGMPDLGVWTTAELTFLLHPNNCPKEFCLYEGSKLVGWVSTQ